MIGENELPFALAGSDVSAIGKRLAESMSETVTLVVFAGMETVLEREMVGFAKSMASLTPKLRADVLDPKDGKAEQLRAFRIERTPVLVLTKGEFARIRYYGVPGGYELPSMLDAIVELSRSDAQLSPKARNALAAVKRRANIKVFVLPTCPYCPVVARHAYRAAIGSEKVVSEVIDTQMFPDLAARHSVMGVPKVVFNDNLDITGMISEPEFFQKLSESDHMLLGTMYG